MKAQHLQSSRGIKPILLEVMLLGSSLSRLKKVGSDQREIDYYARLGEKFKVSIFGYETGAVGEGFSEIPVRFRNKWMQSILGPLFVNRKKINQGLVRTKQFWGCWSGWILAKWTGSQLIIRCGYIWSRAAKFQHPQWPNFVFVLMRLFERVCIQFGDGFIFATEEIAEHYGKMAKSKPSVIIPNGFDLETFHPLPEVLVDHDYAYVGRLIPLKGIQRLLSSIAKGDRVLVIGDGSLSGLAASHPQVTYLGTVPNYQIPRELCRARGFVSMSHTEGNPKCLIEAVLCGLFPVLSDIDAHRKLVEELGYGLILPNDASLPKGDTLKIDPEKFKIFRDKYGFSKVIEREADFCMTMIEKGEGV